MSTEFRVSLKIREEADPMLWALLSVLPARQRPQRLRALIHAGAAVEAAVARGRADYGSGKTGVVESASRDAKAVVIDGGEASDWAQELASIAGTELDGLLTFGPSSS